MPQPEPREGEEEQAFIQRCIGDDFMVGDYPDQEQRIAVCYSIWRAAKGGKIMEHKSIQIKLNEEKEGTFTARIATLNVIDYDGDVTLPGAFPDGKQVLVSAYQHGSWMGELPVGKAVIREAKGEVLADGEFNLNTESGREHYQAVKFAGILQEWSYGFEIKDSDTGEFEGQDVRFLKAVEPYEISPVLLGAGVGTATVAIKQEGAGSTYLNQAEMALAAVTGLIVRTKSLADLRRTEGRALSTTNRERMQKLLTALTEVAVELKELLEVTEPEDEKALLTFLIGVKEKLKYLEATS